MLRFKHGIVLIAAAAAVVTTLLVLVNFTPRLWLLGGEEYEPALDLLPRATPQFGAQISSVMLSQLAITQPRAVAALTQLPAPKIYFYGAEPWGHEPPVRHLPGGHSVDLRECRNDAELAAVESLRAAFGTDDPAQADWFMFAHRITCLVESQLAWGVPLSESFPVAARAYFRPMLHLARFGLPYFNRTGGANHFVVSIHDWGFAAMLPDLDPDERELMLRVTTLEMTTRFAFPGQKSGPGIVIPSYAAPVQGITLLDESGSPTPEHIRDKACRQGRVRGGEPHRACFFGVVRAWGCNGIPAEKCEYSKGSRFALELAAKNDIRLLVSPRVLDYSHQLCSCEFALAPSGWQPWSPRLFDAISLGVPPVIIAEDLERAFARFVNYSEFSLSYGEPEVVANARRVVDDIFARTLERRAAMAGATAVISPLFSYYSAAPYMIGAELWCLRHCSAWCFECLGEVNCELCTAPE